MPSPSAPHPACVALVALVGAACAGGKGSPRCQGLVCAPELPRGADEVAYFDVDAYPVWMAFGTLRVGGGLFAPRDIGLDACRLRLRWSGTREGLADSGPPDIYEPGDRARAIWSVEAKGFTDDDVVEIWRSVECRGDVSIAFGGTNPVYWAGARGKNRVCHTRPSSTKAPAPALVLAPIVERLQLEPPAGVFVAARREELVDACTGEVLLALGELPPPDRQIFPGPMVEFPRREEVDRAVFETLFRPGARRRDRVLVNLAGETAATALRPVLSRARFAAVTGVKRVEADGP